MRRTPRAPKGPKPAPAKSTARLSPPPQKSPRTKAARRRAKLPEPGDASWVQPPATTPTEGALGPGGPAPLAPAVPLPQVAITLRRSLADAIRAGEVHAGSVTVAITPRILAALDLEEREILAALDTEAAGERIVIRFDRLAGMPEDGTVPFHADAVTEESTIAALRGAIAQENAHRDALAAKLRAGFASCTDAHGRITTDPVSLPAQLAARPGVRHPALAELDAYAVERGGSRKAQVHARSREGTPGARRRLGAQLSVPVTQEGACAPCAENSRPAAFGV